jgi:hypothetical protein
LVSPTNPEILWKGRSEDTGKSESHSVMDWIELSVERQIEHSTGNGADFQLVFLVDKPEIDFNQERC